MQAAEPSFAGCDRVTLGCFRVAGHMYAVEATQVREVVRWRPVTPLPQSTPLVEGVIDLHGTLVPVVDLGRLLGGAPVEGGRRARIAITEIDGMLVGLAVEGVVEVLSLPGTALEDPPEIAQAAGSLTRAVARRPESEPILVLSLRQLLESVLASGRDAPEATR